MMEDFDEGIEQAPQEKAGKSGMIGLWIGIAGLVVGMTGIILANRAHNEVRGLEARLAAAPDKTADLQQALKELDERLVKLGSEFVRLNRQDTQIQESTKAGFDTVMRDVRANREALNTVTTQLGELSGKLENWRPATRAAASAPATGGGDAAAAPAGGEPGIHVIQSGDTLSSVAKQYGVTLDRLQAANPGVNPRALRIGQRIVIPQP